MRTRENGERLSFLPPASMPRPCHKLGVWRMGCAIAIFSVSTVIASLGQTFTTLGNFDNNNGSVPQTTLIQGLDGNFYGTAEFGGVRHCRLGCGTIFRITPEGVMTLLHAFCIQDGCPDGSYPMAGLVQATDGNFYGTTHSGGATTSCPIDPDGCGTVFKMTPGGKVETIYNFCSQANCTDGYYPYGALVQASDGNFYGTTQSGGVAFSCLLNQPGCGTVFKISRTGTLSTLHSFQGGTDGAYPQAGLVQASDGLLYGTVTGSYGGGIFKVDSAGREQVVYSFCALPYCVDGAYPESRLVQGADGNLYGTTAGGGTNTTGCLYGGCGTVFKVTGNGALTVLHSFDSSEGWGPYAELVQGTDGSFYGTTTQGGASGSGTIYEVSADGALTTLYNFCSQGGTACTDGDVAWGGLVQGTDGVLYGTTGSGGAFGYGTVFSLTIGLGPFVETLPPAARAGTYVRILGTDLSGASSVTFNGTPTTFNVVKPSFIQAIVPLGATSGFVQVTTPSGTLTSNVPFRVRQ